MPWVIGGLVGLVVVAVLGVVLVVRGGSSDPTPAADLAPDPGPAQADPPDPIIDATDDATDATDDATDATDDATDATDGLSAQQLGEQFGDAVWRVEVEGCGMTATGSGFAITPELFVTNAHVVDIDPSPTLVSRHGEERTATVIGIRSWPDLAVMQVTEPVDRWLEWAPTAELVEGQPLTALSYPTPLLRFSVAPGTLMSFQVENGERIAIASDEITDYGSSGGPLLDDRGRVTGVITEFASGDGRQLVGLSYTHAFLEEHLEAIIAAPEPMTVNCAGVGSPALPDGWDGPEIGTGGNDYGDDAGLDALWDACEAGDLQACDDLYRYSPIGSVYEAFGDSCGDRQPTDTGNWCVDALGGLDVPGGVVAGYGDDAALDRLWDRCATGSMSACDDLYRQSPIGSEYQAFGDTCGERQPLDTGRWCVD